MPRDEFRPVLFVFTLFLAFCVSLIPLGGFAAYFRPESICMVMFYWTLKHPGACGILVGWCVGLLWDVLMGSTLGVHALALALQAYLVLKMLQRLQMFPLIQQSFVVFIIVGIVLMLFRWINGLLAQPATDMAYLLGALSSALLWPLFSLLMEKLENV
ncbi:Cell shape-determining protein [Hahella chejuensis KCTC 2396]|uniref:Rod shape-determining protein MreD n=1 Tax=Hahella chejuensis (strain KCTC 2396) TaxID=349521 RepID=Q2SBH0_HAHCH|nr:rod shape-determining protein MreD [Hahella chejuensis]ABC32004.1 Cell shape-determining protein [Hahella chejuensis KCTC 2396]